MKAAIEKGRATPAQRPTKKVQADQFLLLRQERERFLEEAKSEQPVFEGSLASLVNAGCDREEILTFLCAAAFAHRFDETSDERELFGMSRSGLRKLARDARDVAERIEKANGSLLASPVEAHARAAFSLHPASLPPAPEEAGEHHRELIKQLAQERLGAGERARSAYSLDYEPSPGGRELEDFAPLLPGRLRTLSGFYENEVLSQRGIGSSKSFRLGIAVEKFFVADVKRVTRSEHYREVGELLEAVEIVTPSKGQRKRQRAFDPTGFRKRLLQNKTPPLPGGCLPILATAFLLSRMKSGRKN